MIHTRRPEGSAPERIASLVPSLTEALFALELGPRVVAVTDFCVHPADALAAVPRVGGTKTPDLAALLARRPDLVIANREENRRRDIEALAAAGVPVWLTYPRTVREAVALLGELAELGAPLDARARLVAPAEAARAAAAASPPRRRLRVFCPIWRDPWMAVGPDTYAHDLLQLCGGENIFGNPDSRDRRRRYPVVSLEQVVARQPEVVLLPDEPYAFSARDAAELARLPLPAAASGRISLIDGTKVSWYGPRIAAAIESLRALLGGGEAGEVRAGRRGPGHEDEGSHGGDPSVVRGDGQGELAG